MFSFKGAYFYFLAVKILSIRFVKKIYFTTSFYNKSLKTKLPEQLYFYPNPFLLSSFVNQKIFAFRLSKVNVDTFWNDFETLKEEENLNSFFWLNLINRKNDGKAIQQIISIWIKNNNKYKRKNWSKLQISKRILAWILNADIILNNADKVFKESFFESIIFQVNHLKKNLNDENDPAKKIEIICAIILSGLVFKEYNSNFEKGIRSLKYTVENFFDKDGCPFNRNIYDLVQSSKFLILIKECCKDAQEYIPDFLDDIVDKLVDCLFSLQTSTNKNPLFNGASEFKIDDYLEYLSGLEYKSNNVINNIGQIYIARSKKSLLFFDAGSPPVKKYSKNYQSGPLSFEYFIDNYKIITNCGFGNKISKKVELISRLTSAQSTLCINDSSVVRFERNSLINDAFGNSITTSFKTYDVNADDGKNYFILTGKHNAYENNFNYIFQRTIKIDKKNNNLSGEDNLTSVDKDKKLKSMYSFRFHLYPGVTAVQTMGKNSILIQIDKNKSLIFTSTADNLILEKSIFLGRNQIINNFCITTSGTLNNSENKNILWTLKRNN
ncbi:heparinase II/III family protein [Pelagibacteraceae bacterium]|nr:heparinase II/III family protein [Pelagibacteraceae bacterium]